MSFLKQLLSPFIEFEDGTKKETGTQSPAPSTPPKPPVFHNPDSAVRHPMITANTVASTATATPTYTPTGAIAKPLPEHEQYFERLIADANTKNPMFQGIDFKEFVDSKLDIDGITDEALRYQTAFNIFKTSGLTKAKLLSTGQEYINIIGKDLNNFQGAHAQLFRKELGQNEMLIQTKVQELQQLTQKTNALKKEINSLATDINLAKDKLDIIRNSFLLAGERKQAEIQQELTKIQRYF